MPCLFQSFTMCGSLCASRNCAARLHQYQFERLYLVPVIPGVVNTCPSFHFFHIYPVWCLSITYVLFIFNNTSLNCNIWWLLSLLSVTSPSILYLLQQHAKTNTFKLSFGDDVVYLCYICLMLRLLYLSCLSTTYAGQQREWTPFSNEVSFIPRLVLPLSFHNVVHIDPGLGTC